MEKRKDLTLMPLSSDNKCLGVMKKVAEVEQGVIRNDSVWDKVFFRKIQEKLGGRVKVCNMGHVVSTCFRVLSRKFVHIIGRDYGRCTNHRFPAVVTTT